nr:hypothetical protein [Tanacetum cinerariifolium]
MPTINESRQSSVSVIKYYLMCRLGNAWYVWLLGLKPLDAIGITAAQVYVNTAQL